MYFMSQARSIKTHQSADKQTQTIQQGARTYRENRKLNVLKPNMSFTARKTHIYFPLLSKYMIYQLFYKEDNFIKVR